MMRRASLALLGSALAILALLLSMSVSDGPAQAAGPFDSILERLGVIDSRLAALDVAVAVDSGYCGVGGFVIVDCGAVAHPEAGPAASKNGNLVRLVLLVTLNGRPVSNLGVEHFDFEPTFVPFESANDTSIAACRPAIAACAGVPPLQREGAGSYSIFLTPLPEDGTWGTEGRYYGEITVTDQDGNAGVAVVEIVIEG